MIQPSCVFSYSDKGFHYETDYGVKTRCGVDIFIPEEFYGRVPGALVVVTQDPDEKPSIMDNSGRICSGIFTRIILPNGFGAIHPITEVLWVERWEVTSECRFERFQQVSFKSVVLPTLDFLDPDWHTITPEQIERVFKRTFAQMGLTERTRWNG